MPARKPDAPTRRALLKGLSAVLVPSASSAAGAVGTWLASNGCKFCDTFFERPEMTRESNLNPVLDLLLGSK